MTKLLKGANAVPKASGRAIMNRDDKPTAGKQIITALTRLRDALETGSPPPPELVTVRHVRLDFGSERLSPSEVRAVRDAIGASQPAFALFIGSSADTVRSWEQGKRSPSGMAARFLDEIRRNPDYFRARFTESIIRS